MKVRFWGVRGSVAVSGRQFSRTGGNTTCVEVESEGCRLMLDGGTGLQELGARLGPGPLTATILFTHVHWDHIQGVPFFAPAFHPDSRIQLIGAKRSTGTVASALEEQMTPPRFPIRIEALQAQLSFGELRVPSTFEVGPFRIRAVDLDHPDGVLAYRIEADGRSLVFATDVEHRNGTLDPRLTELAEGCDLLIHDAQYTEAEYWGRGGPSRVGWGHSTWRQAVDVARAAGAGRLALFHHDPGRTDDAVAVVEDRARSLFGDTDAAREGLEIRV